MRERVRHKEREGVRHKEEREIHREKKVNKRKTKTLREK